MWILIFSIGHFRIIMRRGCDGDARNPDSRPFSVEEFMATWRQLERIQKMGLARNIGMSNMTVAKLEAVLPLCEIKPVLIEMELHPCSSIRSCLITV